jgi:hypothetical protein
VKHGRKVQNTVILESAFIQIFDDFYTWHIVYPIPWLFQQYEFVAWTVSYKMIRLRAETVEPFVKKCQNTDHTFKIVIFHAGATRGDTYRLSLY